MTFYCNRHRQRFQSKTPGEQDVAVCAYYYLFKASHSLGILLVVALSSLRPFGWWPLWRPCCWAWTTASWWPSRLRSSPSSTEPRGEDDAHQHSHAVFYFSLNCSSFICKAAAKKLHCMLYHCTTLFSKVPLFSWNLFFYYVDIILKIFKVNLSSNIFFSCCHSSQIKTLSGGPSSAFTSRLGWKKYKKCQERTHV